MLACSQIRLNLSDGSSRFWLYKEKKKQMLCVHACMQSNKRDGPKTSDRASERTLCDVYKFGLEQECGEDAAGRARVSTILSFFLSPRPEREIFAHRTAPLPRNAAFRNFVLHLPICCTASSTNLLLFKKQSKEKKRNEIHQFPCQQFLSSKLSFFGFFPTIFPYNFFINKIKLESKIRQQLFLSRLILQLVSFSIHGIDSLIFR